MRGVTITIMLLVAIGLSAFDVYLAFNHVKGDTISAIIYETALQTFLLPYTFGILMGHFFWPTRVKREHGPMWLSLGLTLFAVLLLDIACRPHAPWHLSLIFAMGFGVGHLLWPNLGRDGE